MSPAYAQLVLFGLQELIQHAPELAADIQALLTKPDATPADWEALRARVKAKSYFDYVQKSSLQQPTPAPAPAPGPA
jgi:hypothetical protein